MDGVVFLTVSDDSPEPLELPVVPELSTIEADPSLDPPSVDDEPPVDFERAPLVDDRSFLAQPEPLKWTVGVDSAFFMLPSAPQEGQKRGPASLIPWITSVTWRQFEQR